MKPQVYKDPRPAEHFDRFHARVRRGRPDWMYEVVRFVLTPYLVLIHRERCIDSQHVPEYGPAIIAPNHFSFLDHFLVAVYIRRKVQFLAKSQLFKPPMQFIYEHGGVFPILRGRRDEEAFKTAHTILDRNGLIVMYSEGGRSRSGALGEPKPGIGRLALETGVPIVPTAIVGSQKARNWKKLQFPKVTVQFGKPVRFDKIENPTREQSQAASEAIFAHIRELYEGLQKEGRKGAVAAARRARRAASQAASSAADSARRPATR